MLKYDIVNGARFHPSKMGSPISDVHEFGLSDGDDHIANLVGSNYYSLLVALYNSFMLLHSYWRWLLSLSAVITVKLQVTIVFTHPL